MKNCSILIVLLLTYCQAYTQNTMGIGTLSPDESAILHIEAQANDKGLLIPRLTTTQRNNISNPAEGLIIYNETSKSYDYFDGTLWVRLIPTPAKFNIDLSGNKVVGLANGTAAGDAVNKGQLDAQNSSLTTQINNADAANLDRDGTDAMTGNLNMGNRRITNVADGTADNDAVTKAQLDDVSVPEVFVSTGGSSSFVGGVRNTGPLDRGNNETGKRIDITAWSDLQNGDITLRLSGRRNIADTDELIIQRNFKATLGTVVSQVTMNFGFFSTDYRYFRLRVEPKNGGTVGYYGLKVNVAGN